MECETQESEAGYTKHTNLKLILTSNKHMYVAIG